ncbi:MAG: DNA-3-methyladenine glycosylase [Rhodospirillaceae bacterium]
MSALSGVIDLPEGFRSGDILAYHRRDAQEVSERVTAAGLEKGLVWAGRPARLAIAFADGHAAFRLDVDGAAPPEGLHALEGTVRRMLGLTQDTAGFEAAHRGHPLLGPLIARRPGLRVAVAATPFDALVWAITGQQISVGAALSIRRRLIAATGTPHSGGLRCHPAPERVAALTAEEMRGFGFSLTKANTLRRLSAAVAAGDLPLDAWAAAPDAEEIGAALRALPGIGPWTVNYALLRGFGCVDGSLHGDVAVRRNLRRLLRRDDKVSEKETEAWLAPFSPWRALAAAHLWAMQADDGY